MRLRGTNRNFRRVSPRVPFNPRKLFRNSEQGVHYDPSDLSTLFQDSAGTTPVTAVEQPVGLMLDKRLGLVLGANQVLNGDFSAGTTNWITGSGVSISGGAASSNGALTIANENLLTQDLFSTAEKLFECRATVTRLSGGFHFRPGGVNSAVVAESGEIVRRVSAGAANAFRIVTAAGGFVGTIDNISVRELPGNHAFQTTAIDRPILRNRYNLLTKTEQFADAAWVKSNATVTSNATTAPGGATTAHLITENTANGEHVAAVNYGTSVFAISLACYMKAGTGRYGLIRFAANGVIYENAIFDLQAGVVHSAGVNITASIHNIGNGWYKCVASGTKGSGAFIVVGLSNGVTNTYTGDGTSGIYIWGASLVPADQASLPYQRVNTATDYDSDPSKFPVYLSANGVNTWMQTNNIDFTATDKVTVFAGVRKLSDSPIGLVTELSAAAGVSNPGSLWIAVPFATGASSNFAFNSVGTVQGTVSSAPIMAPITNVLTCIGNISGDQAILRVNGTQAAVSTADQGTGNYGNYPLYLFRRGGTSLPFNGNFYGLLIRGALTSDPDTLKMEKWLSFKTGVQL